MFCCHGIKNGVKEMEDSIERKKKCFVVMEGVHYQVGEGEGYLSCLDLNKKKVSVLRNK